MDSNCLTESEEALLNNLRQGDEGAFTKIYRTHSMKLFAAAFASLKSEESAKEVVQEIFVSLWVNRKSLAIKQSICGYLMGAVRNKVFNIIDKQGVRERYKQRYLRAADVSDRNTELALEYDELNQAINKEIDALPETTRGIFLLSRFEGLNNGEIAKEFHLSSKAVEYHITKALKTLRVHLRHVMAAMVLIKELF
jgi:RNA polymerase sigma-70 factor (ECF subfamily)